ncbi:MAG: NAD(P)/FAD-dependent oxidoreductase [Patescibacteria group bacterium]|mgnify:CR=1 FL=1
MSERYDVLIVGASFAGLTLAHHLPKHLRVLVVDAKPSAGASVESTGLITTKTYEEFKTFFDIDRFITNPISAICVVAHNFTDHFVSQTERPWIYQTDTKGLVAGLARTVPDNVTVQSKTVFIGARREGKETVATVQTQGEGQRQIACRVLVGADGSHSKVAQTMPGLDRNTRFLFGYERVYFGDVHLGPEPHETIYHYWFGEFSLGYGGWLSPTVVDDRPAVRIGLAKLAEDRAEAKDLLKRFTQRLMDDGALTLEGAIDAPDYAFGSLIPINGPLKRVASSGVILIGDAAGYCGAFAADGIKGCVVSGKEAAYLVGAYLDGDGTALGRLNERMERHDGLLNYYRRQLRYRWLWDRMCRNRTFRAMFDIINQERETFVEQFCDSKDRRRSLAWTVLKWRHALRLLKYALFVAFDIVFPKQVV